VVVLEREPVEPTTPREVAYELEAVASALEALEETLEEQEQRIEALESMREF
jgi:hypothetical protein